MRFARSHRIFLLWVGVTAACVVVAPWNVIPLVLTAPWLVAVLWVTLRNGDGDPVVPPHVAARQRRLTHR